MMVSSFDEALKGMQTKKIPRPDLIFLDLNMPRINGIRCLSELKANANVSEIPVAIYTASNLYGNNVKSLKSGARHFITKPSNFRYICQMIIREIFYEGINPESLNVAESVKPVLPPIA
jgi:DNA-binding response OmpR family regulator